MPGLREKALRRRGSSLTNIAPGSLRRKSAFGPLSWLANSAFHSVGKRPLAGRFIADFFAPAIGLVIEVDGAIHARRPGPDARRDLKLRRAGFRVVRVSAELVLSNLPAAVAQIRAAF